MPSTILIVDDEEGIRLNLKKFFKVNGFNTLAVEDGASAIKTVESTPVEVVILDLRLPDMSGLDVLEKIKQISPGVAVVMITAYGDVETAVAAMKLKADNFVLKPVDLQSLRVVVEKSLESHKAQAEINYLKKKVSQLAGSWNLESLRQPPEIFHAIGLLSDNPSTNVLILGETGTGKGMLARIIHETSIMKDRPFVDINCAGLNHALLESELFGHERGAFTDAKTIKRGLLEVADGGSIFLDEIGELGMGVQAKLLKVIEQRSFRRLGGTQNIEVDVRIMAATSMDLERAVKNGDFRKDLFFRLNVVPLWLPPLRERREDIMPLARIFLDEYNRLFAKNIRDFAPEVEGMFSYYTWPGNIRELKNVVERAVLLAERDLILPVDLPENIRMKKRPNIPINVEVDDWSLESAEKRHIKRALEASNNNRTRAADLLKIHRTTLIKKIRKYNLD